MNRKMFSAMLSLLLVLLLGVAVASAQGGAQTPFNYQGHLTDSGNPANGAYDFEFKLFDAANGGNQLGNSVTKEDVPVNDGAFMVELDFGNGVFIGGARYLEIGVRPGNNSGAYTLLTPRNTLNPVPTTYYAERASALAAPDGNPDNALTVDNDGRIGIGTNPTSQLHITGGKWDLTNTEGDFKIGNDQYRLKMGVSLLGKGAGNGFIRASGGNDTLLTLGAGARNVLSIRDDGNVGIGTEWPQSTLDVRGRATTEVLQITGGADLSEQFDVRDDAAGLTPSPGMVACIDSEHPGELVICNQEYDQTVAGIISGAGGVKPGMLMSQAGSEADGQYPVALTGRVYVLADASQGAIQPGDLLTTSATPGHAMKVTDHNQAQGAILGKAMGSLEEGQGLVLVLVSLQ